MTDVVDEWVGSGPRFPFRPGTDGAMTYVVGMELIR
jgi:hypothetical protein